MSRQVGWFLLEFAMVLLLIGQVIDLVGGQGNKMVEIALAALAVVVGISAEVSRRRAGKVSNRDDG